MNKMFRNAGFYLLIFLITVGIVQFITGQDQQRQDWTYSKFVQQMNAGALSTVDISPDGNVLNIQGQTKSGLNFTSRALYSEDLMRQLGTGGTAPDLSVKIEPAQRESIWLTFLTSILPFVVMFILFFFFLNQAQGGGNKVMSFGKSRARLYTDEKKKKTFADVAGNDEEKHELVEIVEFLKDPRRFAALGARIPKGVLLIGPPGTGKTLLARAVAGEAGVPFFSISGSDFVEMFVGVGASRVRDLFENAKKNAPCIIFIDEIDAVGRHRGAGLGGGHDEREQTLNALLVEMDGFGANEGIIIMAATNRADILDPALLRPGRFDRQIRVDPPDVRGREALLKLYAKNKPMGDDIHFDVLARRTPGFTGADVENLLNEAALLAARRNKRVIEMSEIDEAIDRVIAGPEKRSRVISEFERKIVAYHEAGHAVVGYYLQHADTVHKVTIIPRGMAGGYTVFLPKEERYFITKTEMYEKIAGLLGGRAAETVIFDEISTGAHNDLERATEIARRMVMEFGMSDKLGPMQFGNRHPQVFLGRDLQNDTNYSDAVAFEIDKEMRAIIDHSMSEAMRILTGHRDKLELLAQTVLDRETIDESQIRDLMESGRISEDHEPRVAIHSKDDSGSKFDPNLGPSTL